MEESIYNLIPREYSQPAKPPRYTSKFKNDAKKDIFQNKAPSKTMGPAKVATNRPEEFLKRHEKEPRLPEKKTFKYPDSDYKKPPVPSKNDQPVLGLMTNKNFIKQNAIETIMAVPKLPDRVFVDTKGGDQHKLNPSGLQPVYVHKKDFGQTPGYLKKRQTEMMQAQEDYENYLQMSMQRGAMQTLSDDEREAILRGLKMNWEQLHHEYQGLSVVTDTAPKKYRKERMEAEMKQLERDIELIEKHRFIYIC